MAGTRVSEAAGGDAGADRNAESGLETLSADECLQLLRFHEVGRLVVQAGHELLVFPVNYAMDGDVIVFRTAEGSKLDAIDQANVTYEVDHIDVLHRTGWSVVVHGLAEVVCGDRNQAPSDRSDAAGVRPWVTGERPHLVRIVPQRVTGRRITPDDDRIPGDGRGYL